MITVDTPNGRQTLFNDKDSIDLIRTYISDEFADYISDKIVEFDEVEWRNAQEWASDYQAMEMENEEWRDELYEINSQLQQLSVKAEEPGFSKKKLIAEIDKIWLHIQAVL
jgi:hypothetical protein